MTENEKKALLVECLEVDLKKLENSKLLSEIEEWSSLSMLSFIVLMQENFSKSVNVTKIRELKTVQDLLDYMQ